jgi:hypothetical protein
MYPHNIERTQRDLCAHVYFLTERCVVCLSRCGFQRVLCCQKFSHNTIGKQLDSKSRENLSGSKE